MRMSPKAEAVVAEITGRLCDHPVAPADLPLIAAITEAFARDPEGVLHRARGLSPSERLVAASLLARADYAAQGDDLTGGMWLRGIMYVAFGAHREAALALLR